MVGLVTIAIDQHDVARGQQCLFDHLVRRRSAIRYEKNAVCSKCPCSLLLSEFYVSSGLQQAVETASCRGGLRKKEVQSVELAHVTNPIRFKNRLASRDKQRVNR